MRHLAAALVVSASVVRVASAAPPALVTGGPVETTTHTPGSLAELVRGASGAHFVGWEAPLDPRQHICCSGGGWQDGRNVPCDTCRLEAADRGMNVTRLDEQGTPGRMWVFLKVDGSGVASVRLASSTCRVDLGGRSLRWLDALAPADGLRLLAEVASSAPGTRKDEVQDRALAAIGLHGTAESVGVLERLATSGGSAELRRHSAFWLGNAGGARGFAVLQRMMREERDPEVREHVVFALSQSEEPGAVGAMIQTAKADADAEVRGRALFWLSQKAGREASQAISEAIDEDPDTEVKKKAVFALSQLPEEQGVPLLIQTARENRNPAVRRQAMFWLGQSKDERALAFFESILTR